MFCPHCGASDQRAEAYCTRCGEWLLPVDGTQRRTSSPQEKMRVMVVFSGINAVMALCSAICLYAAHLGRPDVHWSVYMAAALCLVIGVHQTISFIFNWQIQSRIKQSREEPRETAQLASPATPPALPAARTLPFTSPYSVTENTTDLLDRVPRAPVRRD